MRRDVMKDPLPNRSNAALPRPGPAAPAGSHRARGLGGARIPWNRDEGPSGGWRGLTFGVGLRRLRSGSPPGCGWGGFLGRGFGAK